MPCVRPKALRLQWVIRASLPLLSFLLSTDLFRTAPDQPIFSQQPTNLLQLQCSFMSGRCMILSWRGHLWWRMLRARNLRNAHFANIIDVKILMAYSL